MAKTIEDLQNLLTAHGYACERMLDVIVATTVATKTYENSAGENAIEIHLSIDRPDDCVAVEILQAFDLRKTEHREATRACLMTASGRRALNSTASGSNGRWRISPPRSRTRRPGGSWRGRGSNWRERPIRARISPRRPRGDGSRPPSMRRRSARPRR
jgi:hypothetical protein